MEQPFITMESGRGMDLVLPVKCASAENVLVTDEVILKSDQDLFFARLSSLW